MNKLWTPDQEENKVIPFAKPITGGSGTSGRKGNKWLKDIEVNSLFLAKDSFQKTFVLTSWHLVNITNLSACLFNPDEKIIWVDIEDFSNRFIFQEVVGKVIDDDSRTIQPSPVANVETVEVLD